MYTWMLVIASIVLVVAVWRLMDGWLGDRIERSMTRHESPFLWGGEPGTRAPKGQVACRDCGYFSPRDAVDREGLCFDCRIATTNVVDLLDWAFEHDVSLAPCRHSAVEWMEDGDALSLVCSDCSVVLVEQVVPTDEWEALTKAIEDEEIER